MAKRLRPSTTRAARRRRSWRGIRLRLVVALLVPTIAAIALGAVRVSGAVRDSQDATRAASLASALPDSFRLALQLQVERDTFTSTRSTKADREKAGAATDRAVSAWRGSVAKVDSTRDSALRQDLHNISTSLDAIDDLRSRAVRSDARLSAQTAYTNTQNTLLGLAGRLPDLGSAQALYGQATGLGQVRTAAEALADERTLVAKAISAGSINQYDMVALATAAESYHAASQLFYENASSRARTEWDTINGPGSFTTGSRAPMQEAVATLLSNGDPDSVGMNGATWNAASGDFLAQTAGVISTAAADLAQAVDVQRDAARRDAIVTALAVLGVLLLVLLITIVVARSILRPLNRLRDAALDIAQHGLPDRVRRLEESDEAGDLSVEPIPVGSRDEIAEVATAFDAVHAEAVRLAGEQTQMRANVNKMFVNLSRRSQSLVERQLRLIDELESGEQDPEHLSNLFRLDHLATRMRRNDESLMVLAGGDTGQGARGPVPVLDVLRAASSEVEQFARVEIESGETAKFRGSVAGDLVHLLAELIENATNFSPPDTSVVVRSSRTSPVSPLVIEIHDLGIGMTAHELDASNEKLRSAGGLDADVARMMGLVVASRLAARHGLSVELRGNTPRGVVARVEVPTAVLVQPETRSSLLVDAVDSHPEPPLAPRDATSSMPEQLRLPEPAAETLEPLVAPDPVVPVVPAAPAVEPVGTSALDEPWVDDVPPALPTRPVGNTPMPPSGSALPGAPMPPSVRPPDGYTPSEGPVASEPPVKNWFTTTVPLRDPEELLNNYLTGRAEGVGGAIKNPFGSLTRRNGSTVGKDGANGTPVNGSGPNGSDVNGSGVNGSALNGSALNGSALNGSALNGSAFGGAPEATASPASPVDRAPEQPRPDESPSAPPLTSSGLPTRIPRNSFPAEEAPFDAFGSGAGTPPAPSVPEAAPESQAVEPVELVKPVRGPVLDPLIAELAADVLNAPSAEEALAEAPESEDDSSIFASLQSEWFTRRTPLEARRSQPDATDEPEADGADWVSPGDEGWRRAAELAEPDAGEQAAPVTSEGLPVRVPGRNLVPGSAAETPVIPVTGEGNVVPMPRLERRRNRGLSSFQQGVSRARVTDTPVSAADASEEITVPGAYEATENRTHEEQQ